MSKYTTGEMAKLCGVSVRTIQYYDAKGILNPSELTEGGRRLYSEEDRKRMKIIGFLKEAGLPLKSIRELLSEPEPGRVIALMLDQQEQMLQKELQQRQASLAVLETIRKNLKNVPDFSVQSIGDIAHIMKNQKQLRKIRTFMLAVGGVLDLIEIGTLIYWIKSGVWQPFALGMCVAAGMAIWVTMYYFKKVAYICPQCHRVFQPSLKQAFFANHTPNARKLTCTECGYHGFCVETCAQE